MSSRLAIPQQLDALPINIAPLTAPARGLVSSLITDTPSEFAQLIESLSPQPVNREGARNLANAPIPEPGTKDPLAPKNATIANPHSLQSARVVAYSAASPDPGAADSSNTDARSGFAQLIQSLSPQPSSREGARTFASAPISEPATKNESTPKNGPAPTNTIAANPRGAQPARATAGSLAPPAKEINAQEPEDPPPVVAALQEPPTGPAAPSVDASSGSDSDTTVRTQISADVPPDGESTTPVQPLKQESAVSAAPAAEDDKLTRKTEPVKTNDNSTPPATAIATTVLPLPPAALRLFTSNSTTGNPPAQHGVKDAPALASPQESASTLTAAPALEVRIRAADESKETPAQPQPPATPGATSAPQTQLQPETVQPVAASAKAVSSQSQLQPQSQPQLQPQVQSQAQPQIQPQSNPAAVAPSVSAAPQPQALPVAPRAERTLNQPAQPDELAAEPPAPPRAQAQPLRSVSLEFTPDGATDVRLRLSEQAGDVHITLHSTDPALTGRLSEGVHDLASSLANAGYDAQAWTPGQERQGGHRQPREDSPQDQRRQTADPDAEDFDTAMQQPTKEFS